MRRWLPITVLVVMASAAAPMAIADDALGAIDTCVRKLDPDVDIGYERIAARCPELMRRLDESSWSTWLPRDWKQPGNDLSAGSLQELRVLVARELGTHTTARTPRVERLSRVLVDLGETSRGHDGWWTRFKAWLHDVFGQHAQVDDEGWLARMIAHLGVSQTAIELVSYAALTLVVVLAGLIVVNELRSAGILRTKRERPSGQDGADSVTPSDSLSRVDFERAPLRHKPRFLLELIATRLMEQNRLPPSRGLTVRELTRAAALADENDRGRLAELAQAAEHIRFSDREVSPDHIELALARGRELLERLDTRGFDRQIAGGRS
jgi:Domain of unknown function (DUF4129)